MRLSGLKRAPLVPFSNGAERDALADLVEAAEDRPALARRLSKPGAAERFLGTACSLSPFLLETARTGPDIVERVLDEPLDAILDDLEAAARSAWLSGGGPVDEARVMAELRRVKKATAFVLALADLGGLMDTQTVTARLSELAEACLSACVDHLLRAAHDAGKVVLPDPDRPSAGSGLVVIGMGKLGAGELNYSSDIDVIVLYDPDAGIVADPVEAGETFARMVRRLVRIMQERTAGGYVFRTDLRLRPDPGSTPLAISLDAALNYYEGRGQNWERAAFIKARAVAGDREAGKRFLAELRPFVFRKYLDYAAIADIHSIKRQIHAHRGHGEIAVAGHNVKLGRGGIREIEFFVQTQQLIAGGRMPELRVRRTDEALSALIQAGWISEETAEDMRRAYWYLRSVEHRIQMVRDEQSHTLPEDPEELQRIALMCGAKDVEAFSSEIETTLQTVERHYASLFEQEKGLGSDTGNLVFTGEENDPDTIETLKALGFERPDAVSKVIRTWHYGRYRATRSVEARERLTELTPRLLAAFGATRRADEAILRFDAFLAGLPAGIQLFSLLGNNPGLMSLTVTIMAAAPRLAAIIARRPHVFDGLLDPALLADLPSREEIAGRIAEFVDPDLTYEEVLDRLRIVAAEQKFLIGVRLLSRAIDPRRAAEAQSDLADCVITAALDAVIRQIEGVHGRVADGRVAVLGLGKLGSRELTAGSDIDVILLYDHAPGYEESDGEKPIDPVRYYTRLTQRLVAALSAPTAEGVLYEVDLRLRPSGNKGPVATSLSAFDTYQNRDAWIWEHMALSRARFVAGDRDLGERAEAIVATVLERERTPGAVADEVRGMRGLIEQEKPPYGIWDLKLVPGGLIDIEFVAQYLALTAPDPDGPGRGRPTGTVAQIEAYGPAVIGNEATETLVAAHAFYTTISQLVRLCIEGAFEPDEAPAGLIDLLGHACEAQNVRELEGRIEEHCCAVRAVFVEAIGEPDADAGSLP
nr:bifunctional [glutamine synthetase] adenylyltransferase/[glutamine synthetase]-adenylyl-L-tyrosine phosphorylase [Pararhizobium mangrovi]